VEGHASRSYVASPFASKALRIRRIQWSGWDFSLHSQMRRTDQPLLLSWRRTRLSRATFRLIFSCQKTALRFGVRLRLQLCPCQKQPSTNTATFLEGQAKSGFPGSGRWRRHPDRQCARRALASAISVVAFPVLRIRDISSDRERPANVVRSSTGSTGACAMAWEPRDYLSDLTLRSWS